MNPIKYLIAADPIARFQPKYDTSLRMAAELLKRGIEVDYLDTDFHDVNLATDRYLGELPVLPIVSADPKRVPFFEFGERRLTKIQDYRVVLNRRDPPVDATYRKIAAHFAKAPANILQINDPTQSVSWSEHELPLRYLDYAIPTTVCCTFEELKKAVNDLPGEAVVKPYDQCSGIGIGFFPKGTPESALREHLAKWNPVIVQPFIDEITKSGDLRILVFNHVVLGSVLRVPKAGSRLANLHQGATGRAHTPSQRQLEASRKVAEDLTPKGLYLLGLDFIGEGLSEVNITSPSALVQINEVMGIQAEVRLIDEIEKLRRERL